MTTHSLPPGKYFIGDPGFVFDASWADVLQSFVGEAGRTLFNGLPICGARPAMGNGLYFDQNGVEYEIKYGVLAAVPIELVEVPNGEERGTVMLAQAGLDVVFEAGIFRFNQICIDTADSNKATNEGYDLDPADDKFV